MSNTNNFVTDVYTLKSYVGKETSVIIPSDIKIIGENAFRDSNVENVLFEGESLRIIQDGAFQNCSKLRFIELPNQVVQIGKNAFAECTDLQFAFVPSSVVFIDDGAFSGDSNLVVVGDKNSAIDQYSKANNLIFRTDKTNVIKKIKALDKKQNESFNKTFKVFGESVVCTKTYSIFKENVDYYDSMKEKTYKDLIDQFPKKYGDAPNFKRISSCLQDPYKNVLKRVERRGVIATEKDINNDAIAALTGITEMVAKYTNYLMEVISGTANDIKDFSIARYQEAKDNATGLSYGIIGGPMDMALYDLDNLLETRKQLNQNMAQAEMQIAQYTDDYEKKATEAYKKGLDIVKPKFKEAINIYMDALCESENGILANAGIIDLPICSSYNRKKSDHYAGLRANNESDLCFNVALSLKNDPTNLTAYKRVIDSNIFNENVFEVASFMGKAKDVSDMLLQKLCNMIKAGTNPSYILSVYDKAKSKMTMQDSVTVLSELSKAIKHSISEAAQEFNTNLSSEEYCNTKLKSLLSDEDLESLAEHHVKAPAESWKYEDVFSYMMAQRETAAPDQKIYDQACKDISNAKTRKEFCDAREQFSQIADYKDSKEKIEYASTRIRKIDEYKAAVINLTNNPEMEQIDNSIPYLSGRTTDKALLDYCVQYKKRFNDKVGKPGDTGGILLIALLFLGGLALFAFYHAYDMYTYYAMIHEFSSLPILMVVFGTIPLVIAIWILRIRNKSIKAYKNYEKELLSIQGKIIEAAKITTNSDDFLAYTN